MLPFVLGLVLLLVGAEALVRGASRLATTLGVSPLVIGLTVVAFGTSAPELAVSLQGAIGGRSDLAIGNVVGSNSFNVLFILGASALVTPLKVAQQLVRFEVPLMIGVSAALPALGRDGVLGRTDGAVLAAGIIAYTGLALARGRKEPTPVAMEYEREFGAARPGYVAPGFLVLGGLAALVLGARWLVDGATSMARALGISELVIGITIVAVGTSLPEVATSLVAAFRGERDIAVGNVVGSNLFNILAVLGVSALAATAGLAFSRTALTFDVPVMILAAVACLPVFLSGHVITRREGASLLGGYILYVVTRLQVVGSAAS